MPRAPRLLFYAAVLFTSVQFGGCVPQKEELRSRPTIGANPEWRLEEGCGSERCGGWPVDFLYGHGLIVRIESSVYVPPPVFLIRVMFILTKSMQVGIDPSLTTAELSSGELVQAQVFFCHGKVFDVERRIQVPPIRSKVVLSADSGRDCLFFVFDAPPPPVDEEFKMTIRGATLNGRPLNIPEITFKPILTRY